MLENLPIGMYAPGESLVHHLRARTKLVLLIWLALALFFANHHYFHYGVYALTGALLLAAVALARISPRYLLRRMRLLLLLIAIGSPFSLIWTTGTTWHTFNLSTLSLHGLTLPIQIVVTYDGLWFTFTFAAILLLLYLGTMLLTLTTTPVALAEGIVLLLRPLRWLHLPADEFGLMTLVALRFVPTLLQEADQLIKAQVSRGADFTTGSPRARVRGVATLIVPLIQGALRRAGDLSAALEARGYGVMGQATLLHEGRLRLLDWALLVIVPALTLLLYFKL
ncbi:MAG: energy-coupling factor transporter transmembrane component T [Ktedonobacterales bacterium]